jgi:hypothetical protein
MISASEARALTRSFDEVTRELEMIEEQIKFTATKGSFSTWWYPDGRIKRYSYGTLKARLEEAGYSVSINYGDADNFYIDWRGQK